jgi:predicted PurR-regulated permease PerM
LTAEIRPLVAIGTGALVVACLYWGQGVLIPVALAGLVAFLLSPVVNAIDRWGAGRAASVLAVVLLAFCLVGGVGWVLLRQLVSLADELPQYSANIRQRMADVRGLSKGGSVEKVQRTLNEVVGEMQKDEPKATAAKPIPVIVEPPSPLLARLPGLLDVLAATGVVTVLVIFMLFERQDLRDRLIRLVGYRRVTVTTRALDEATARITSSSSSLKGAPTTSRRPCASFCGTSRSCACWPRPPGQREGKRRRCASQPRVTRSSTPGRSRRSPNT